MIIDNVAIVFVVWCHWSDYIWDGWIMLKICYLRILERMRTWES